MAKAAAGRQARRRRDTAATGRDDTPSCAGQPRRGRRPRRRRGPASRGSELEPGSAPDQDVPAVHRGVDWRDVSGASARDVRRPAHCSGRQKLKAGVPRPRRRVLALRERRSRRSATACVSTSRADRALSAADLTVVRADFQHARREKSHAGADPAAAGPDPHAQHDGADPGRGDQRLEKLLEDAGIRLFSVASDGSGASGRAMPAALVAGQRDPVELAKRGLRSKIRRCPRR